VGYLSLVEIEEMDGDALPAEKKGGKAMSTKEPIAPGTKNQIRLIQYEVRETVGFMGVVIAKDDPARTFWFRVLEVYPDRVTGDPASGRVKVKSRLDIAVDAEPLAEKEVDVEDVASSRMRPWTFTSM
jgi:hypothetical protein